MRRKAAGLRKLTGDIKPTSWEISEGYDDSGYYPF
jgi:hypothetical protein